MAFHVLPLEQTDAAKCTSIYLTAFQKDAHSIACWPRTAAIRKFWESMIHHELADTSAHWFKAVDPSTGEIAAFAKWNEPKPGVLPSMELPPWPVEADAKLCDETFGDFARQRRDLMGVRGHWYLEILASDPIYKGRGAGSQLLRWGLEQADLQGVETYLEASPGAMGLYVKYGFGEAARTDILIDNARVKQTWYREVFMIRPAASDNDTTNN